ncbi:MAG: hypothetical protein QOJ13_1992 [Gaiellales bacterium]|nr:hypothetical protein [Gaiellales bacterium]
MVVIGCFGELDLVTCRDLDAAIDESFTTDLSVLHLDLKAVTFFDSSAVRCLVECHRRCANHRVRLQVVTSPVIDRVLGLVGFRSATQVAGSPS